MNLRPYSPADLEMVISIFRSNIPKYFGPSEEPGLRNFLADARSHDYFVGELDGEIVASGGIAANEDKTVSLCWGMVRGNLIGTGLGRELTEFRIRKALEKYPQVPIVISTSQHTQGFYERFGFRLTRHEPNGFGPGIDICEMRLDA